MRSGNPKKRYSAIACSATAAMLKTEEGGRGGGRRLEAAMQVVGSCRGGRSGWKEEEGDRRSDLG